ncbi:MAG TPA: hypothetical protein DEB40_07635 [Elusimicrobia bacterium]|nr:hypothetical protein [Elusimicrobiota bacterium]HBT61599.1 hypothetical protein [Elusimicrobiota bacterium]
MPAEFRILAFLEGVWTEVFATKDNDQCRKQTDGSNCVVSIRFRTVPAAQVRFEFNDLSTPVRYVDPQQQDAHGWFEQIEVNYDKSASPSA